MTDVDWPRRAGLSAALDEAAIVAITDRAGRILYCNDKFEAVSGYSREELIGQTHRVVNSGVHPRDYFRNLYRTIAGRGVARHHPEPHQVGRALLGRYDHRAEPGV